MKYVVPILLILVITNCTPSRGINTVISSKTAIQTYKSSPLFVEKLSNDSLLKFFKEKSIRSTLPIYFNYDSLFVYDTLQISQKRELYNIRILPFISLEFASEYDPSTFEPFYYEFDSIKNFHFVYLFMESMPSTNAHRAIFLFTLDSSLTTLDYFPIAENWLFSGSAGASKEFRRKNKYTFSIINDSYDIDYDYDGNGHNYLMKIKSIITITNKGKIEIKKSDTTSWEEKFKFD